MNTELRTQIMKDYEQIKQFDTTFVGKECLNCSEKDKELSQCARCHVAKYCSSDCQKTDWPKHKKICAYLEKTLATYNEQQGELPLNISGLHGDVNVRMLCAIKEKAYRNGANINTLFKSAPKVILKRDKDGFYTLPHVNVPGFVNMGTIRSHELNICFGSFVVDTANGILPKGWVIQNESPLDKV